MIYSKTGTNSLGAEKIFVSVLKQQFNPDRTKGVAISRVVKIGS